MAPSLVHLPNGQTLTVTPVFGGLSFKANDLNTHHNVFPPGWTIILNCEDGEDEHEPAQDADPDATPRADAPIHKKHHIHRFRKPSLRQDHLYISSISNPASNEFRPASSPTRQIAMMLWATLYWYFHQEEPAPQLKTPASAQTPIEGRPKGDWRVNINREGIFKGKHLLPKLERMGLIASEDSTVGLDPEDGVATVSEGWTKMFVSRKVFWQLDARIYLFTLTPLQSNSPFPSISPASSRPASPNRNSPARSDEGNNNLNVTATTSQAALTARGATPPGPFTSGSHLPTFYPPAPLQYTFTNHIRHPIRPKPPRQGEVFYTRYVPSLEQYISFRVASLSKRPCLHTGPTTHGSLDAVLNTGRDALRSLANQPVAGQVGASNVDPSDTTCMTDAELLHKWMNDPRVAHSWGEQGPIAHQEQFLKAGLTSRHSFPVIGCFDGKPFAYFEIYWVKEDRLGSHLGGDVGEWDRGLHVLVGEQEFRGPHRIKVWLSALVHYCWLADSRTNVAMLEPRVDNEKYVFQSPTPSLSPIPGNEKKTITNFHVQAEEVLRKCGLLQGARDFFPAQAVKSNENPEGGVGMSSALRERTRYDGGTLSRPSRS